MCCEFFRVFFDGCSDACGFGVVSVVVWYAFVVDVSVKCFGEVDHGLLFEEAALTMKGEAVRVQFGMIVEDEALYHGPPGLHHITNQTGLTELHTMQITKVRIKMRSHHGNVDPSLQHLIPQIHQVIERIHGTPPITVPRLQEIGEQFKVLIKVFLGARAERKGPSFLRSRSSGPTVDSFEADARPERHGVR